MNNIIIDSQSLKIVIYCNPFKTIFYKVDFLGGNIRDRIYPLAFKRKLTGHFTEKCRYVNYLHWFFQQIFGETCVQADDVDTHADTTDKEDWEVAIIYVILNVKLIFMYLYYISSRENNHCPVF